MSKVETLETELYTVLIVYTLHKSVRSPFLIHTKDFSVELLIFVT